MGEGGEDMQKHGPGEDAEHQTLNEKPADTSNGEAPEPCGEPDETKSAGNPAKLISVVVILLLVLLVAFYALSDAWTPSSARGTVMAQVVQIAPRVSGRVTQVWVENNAVVEAGDPLFSIEGRAFELAVQAAEAHLKTALQNVSASSASLIAAQAAVTKARVALDHARSKANRILQLEKRHIVSASRADDARARLAEAKAQLKKAQANLKSARAQLGPEGENNPAIIAAEAQLAQAQYDLASTTVRAPHFGVVTNVTLTPGQYINAGEPTLTFIDARAAWVTVMLRENQLQNVNPGDPAHLLFDALPGRTFEGRVQSVAWGISPGRKIQNGLVVSQSNSRWFEPARRIPVRIELAGGMGSWPRKVPVGGKVDVVIFAGGSGNPVAWIASGLQWLQSWLSYLH